jgi:hypothetical protein
MRKSPTIEVREHELDAAEGNKLAYVAQLYKGSVPAWPAAIIAITGSTGCGSKAADRLYNKYGVPSSRITIVPGYSGPQGDQAAIGLIYFPEPAGTKKFKLQFKFDLGEIVEVEFEVSPDGAYVESVEATVEMLKKKIKEKAFGGRVKDIKVAVKPSVEIEWEREVSTKAKMEITNKLKVALEGEVKLPGNITVKVELYGSFFRKYPADEAPKTGIEGGLVLSVPF